MKKHTRNPNRSLEIVVSAPIETCLQQLRSLKVGGFLTSERTTVKVFRVKRSANTFRYEVKLRVGRGSSEKITAVRGTVQYDENFHTTTIIGAVEPFIDRILVQVMVFSVILLISPLFLPLLIQDNPNILVLFALFFLGIVPMSFMSEHRSYQEDSQRILQMVEQALTDALLCDKETDNDGK